MFIPKAEKYKISTLLKNFSSRPSDYIYSHKQSEKIPFLLQQETVIKSTADKKI